MCVWVGWGDNLMSGHCCASVQNFFWVKLFLKTFADDCLTWEPMLILLAWQVKTVRNFSIIHSMLKSKMFFFFKCKFESSLTILKFGLQCSRTGFINFLSSFTNINCVFSTWGTTKHLTVHKNIKHIKIMVWANQLERSCVPPVVRVLQVKYRWSKVITKQCS